MRNLKRALSLALASVMVIGMMVVGTGASYQDVKATDNVEAIEVLQAVGIMTGDENGDFNPDDNVTRNEIAVVMSNLLNLDYDYYRGVNPFTDVPDWAAPYVAACAAEGVVAGIGGTLYGGSNNVTAAQAALMIMKALGYFQYQNDFGTDWQIATIRQASYINLFDGINANAETALTRNQIAQLVLNGLKANMVSFTGTVGAEINGVSIGYVPEYTAITNANKKYDSIDTGTSNIGADDKYYVQLGEELYNGDLKLNDDIDVFGRPARCWEYDGKEIGTYVNDSMLLQEYTTKVTGDMLYELLTRSTVNNYDLTVVIDGVHTEDFASTVPTGVQGRWFDKSDINRNNDATLGATGNGVLTQVFVDNEEKEITVAIINTYLALANKDYDEKKDEIGFNVYGLDTYGDDYYKELTKNAEDMKTMKVTGEDFDIADLAEDDAVLVTVADGEIQTIADCEVIAGTTIDAFETSSNSSNLVPEGEISAVEIDGTEYKMSSAAEFDADVMEYYTGINGASNLKDLTYNVYMDAYGYVIGVEEVEKANNYVFVTGIALEGSTLGNRSATANAIFLDGTMDEISVNMTKSTFQSSTDVAGLDGNPMLNAWFTYTVNSNKVYTLKEVSNVYPNGVNNDTYKPGGFGGVNNNTNSDKLAQSWQGSAATAGEINNQHISLKGANSGSFRHVYGTDETVYLTVGLTELAQGAHYGIINEVTSVVTGIGNANLEIWNNTDVGSEGDDIDDEPANIVPGSNANGVYTLYNDDGDVIAAIVVGEDAGSTENLVYVHSDNLYREKYDPTTGKYTWSRKVISNGQEVILTEVGEGAGDLESMQQHTWYQVKFNAEGNVIEAKLYSIALTGNGVGGEWEYVEDSADLGTAIGAEDSVLYYSNTPYEITNQALRLTGKTLWLNTAQTEGFRVAEDVNIALIQRNNNTEKTYYETGVSSLKTIVNELMERHTAPADRHPYVISAIIEKGVATSIVIRDNAAVCDPYAPGDWDDSKTGNLDLTGLVFDTAGMKVYFYNETGSNILSTAKAEVLVRTADGTRVTYEKNVAVPAIADGAAAFITFSYDQTPTSAGKYSVELTIKDAAGNVIGTGVATLANS